MRPHTIPRNAILLASLALAALPSVRAYAKEGVLAPPPPEYMTLDIDSIETINPRSAAPVEGEPVLVRFTLTNETRSFQSGRVDGVVDPDVKAGFQWDDTSTDSFPIHSLAPHGRIQGAILFNAPLAENRTSGVSLRFFSDCFGGGEFPQEVVLAESAQTPFRVAAHFRVRPYAVYSTDPVSGFPWGWEDTVYVQVQGKTDTITTDERMALGKMNAGARRGLTDIQGLDFYAVPGGSGPASLAVTIINSGRTYPELEAVFDAISTAAAAALSILIPAWTPVWILGDALTAALNHFIFNNNQCEMVLDPFALSLDSNSLLTLTRNGDYFFEKDEDGVRKVGLNGPCGRWEYRVHFSAEHVTAPYDVLNVNPSVTTLRAGGDMNFTATYPQLPQPAGIAWQVIPPIDDPNIFVGGFEPNSAHYHAPDNPQKPLAYVVVEATGGVGDHHYRGVGIVVFDWSTQRDQLCGQPGPNGPGPMGLWRPNALLLEGLADGRALVLSQEAIDDGVLPYVGGQVVLETSVGFLLATVTTSEYPGYYALSFPGGASTDAPYAEIFGVDGDGDAAVSIDRYGTMLTGAVRQQYECGDGYCFPGEEAWCSVDCDLPPPDEIIIDAYAYCGDGMCDAGEIFDSCPSDCDPEAPCADALEPNDGYTDATALGTASLAARVCQYDHDLFAIPVTGAAGGSIDVQINFTHALGDLDLQLLDAAGNAIGWSTGVTNYERITISTLAPGTYYLHVYGYNGAQNDYTIHRF